MAEQGIINTFSKGLSQDSAFILQPDGTYRNMKNGMLISFDGNHYTVEMTKGNKVLLTLNPRYLPVNGGELFPLDSEPMPIGFISFIDKLVVFSTNSEAATGYGEIGVITFTRVSLDFVGTYVPYYHHANLNFTKLHKIEGFSFRENDNIERVYWTDNFNEPRVFDIANPIFTAYITTGNLSLTKQYMVLGGVISSGGFYYGTSGGTNVPSATPYINGNVFTPTSAAFTTVSGTPLVIEYYPLSLLDWSPTRSLGNIDFQEYGSGNKNCGSSIYFYRLSRASDGFATSWSYASNPIHIGTNNDSQYLTTNSYANFVGKGDATGPLINSGKSVIVKVSSIDLQFDTIELACAEFLQKSDIPYAIKIVSKLPVTGTSMSITDNGSANLGTVTIADLTLFPASILKCKTLTTNKNYNIVGNITEREEFELDLSGVSLTAFNYPLISHGDYINSCINGNIPIDQSPTTLELTTNPVAGGIKPWSRYLVSVSVDATNRVEYPVASGLYYYTGDVFVGATGYSTATFTGTAQARPCTTRNRYTKINPTAFSGNRVEDAIPLKTAFWDYKDPTIASHNKGYWSSERYRLALLCFDKKGNPFYAKYIKGGVSTNDIDMPTISVKGGLVRSDAYSGGLSYSLNPSAIKASGLDFPESVINQMSGFSIVRAERDARIVTQGLMIQSGVRSFGGGTTDFITPLGTFIPAAVASGTVISPTYFTYLCPDNNLGTFFNYPFSDVGVNMEEGCFIEQDNGTKTEGDYHNVFVKMFRTKTADGQVRKWKLASINGLGMRSYNENALDPLFDGAFDYKNFDCGVDGNNFKSYIVGACATNGTFGIQNILTVGCRKLVIKPSVQVNYWNDTINYGSSGAGDIKLLANILTSKDKSTQYGGNSDAAIANTLYMSTGHFQPINAAVKADTLNGTFAIGKYAGQNKYTFNNIEIFGGDCFTNMVDQMYSLWSDAYHVSNESMSYGITYPCEGNANYNLRRGRKLSVVGASPGSGGESIRWDAPARLEDYNYNQGYSTEGTFVKYPSLPLNYKFTGKFEYRERWAGLKYTGELINSFRTFRIPDYRDLNGANGQINNLKARDSKLFYWQDHSVGYTPILERQLVGGSALGDATALGVTGVIDRYDDIDTYFGNQHQHGLVETEYGFAWFDMRRRAFMVMGIGSKPEEASMVKGLQVFFNNEFNEGLYPTSGKIYNTNNLSVAEKPLLGFGIVGCYDPTFKMTYLTFKYEQFDNANRTTRDFTLGYNHILNAFVSFTDNCPAIWHNHNDLVLTTNNPKHTNIYSAGMPPINFVVGDTVNVVNTEYICISPVSITSYPGSLGTGGTNPLEPTSTFWRAINKTNEIYLQNFGAELCKFYGKVWDHSMEVVVNAKTDMAVTPERIQFKATGPNFTSVEYSTDDQTASDMNISLFSRMYRYIDKAYFSSVPLSPKGRLTDYYVKIKFTYKNYVTDPRTAKNIQKVSQWLQTFFITKK